MSLINPKRVYLFATIYKPFCRVHEPKGFIEGFIKRENPTKDISDIKEPFWRVSNSADFFYSVAEILEGDTFGQ